MESKPTPSFSLVLETENLAKAGLTALSQCLHSLEDQTLSPTRANEVILVDSQDAPAARIEELRTAFPWVEVVQVDKDTPYYAAKMAGFKKTTGELVVFCDSDCRYANDWLEQLLGVFEKHPDADVAAGETDIAIDSVFSFAVALIWGFPTYSDRPEPYPVRYYAANNVAFRRKVLESLPIPDEVEVYRGNCSVHSVQMRRAGWQLYKNDQARTQHPLPAKDFRELFWRFFLNGRDWLIWDRHLVRADKKLNPVAALGADVVSFFKITGRWLARPLIKLPKSLARDPGRWKYLPLGLPLVAITEVIFLTGFVAGLICPKAILRAGVHHLEEAEG